MERTLSMDERVIVALRRTVLGHRPADRRRITAVPTKEGFRLLESAPSPLQDRFRSAFSEFEEWEQTQTLATLQRIAAMMDAEQLEAAPVLTTEEAT